MVFSIKIQFAMFRKTVGNTTPGASQVQPAPGGALIQVTDIRALQYNRGLWVEVVTLLINGFNDNYSVEQYG